MKNKTPEIEEKLKKKPTKVEEKLKKSTKVDIPKKVKKVKYNRKEFYQLDNIFAAAPEAKYYVIWGERSNGKTFAVCEYAIDKWFATGEQLAVVRRLDENFKGKYGSNMFDNFLYNPTRGNIIEQKSNGEYNSVKYVSRKWYFVHRDEEGNIDKSAPEPFAHAFALAAEEKYKSLAFPRITTILNDEFISMSGGYLTDEFIFFTSILSTIIRNRDNVKIFLCANAIPSYNPYIIEMGLTRFKTQEPGKIDIYHYGTSKLVVAVEHTGTALETKGKKSDVYFAFDNPKLKMITSGEFMFDIYPHAPFKWIPKEVKFIYFIVFDGEIFQCEIIRHQKQWITFIHEKTTPLKDEDNDLIYSQDIDPRPNHARRILHPVNELQNSVARFFAKEKVFYQDNRVGEQINQYLLWQDSI